MKKLVLICIFIASLFAQDQKYITLKTPIPDAQNSLIEVFSYDCPWCYKYDSIIPMLLKNLPKNMTFKPYHLTRKAEFAKEASELFAVLLNNEKNASSNLDSAFNRVKKLYFDSYHIKRMHWDNGDEFLALGLKEAKMSKDEFNKALKIKNVQKMLKEWDNIYNVPEITQVPSFIVNGKYLIKLGEVKSVEELSKIIDELNAK